MLKFNDVSFSYDAASPSEGLSHITLSIPKGQVVLVCGRSGCGKTTLTRLICGLIPNYYEGALSGSVTLDGDKISEKQLYEIAPFVGSVFQDPRSQFFAVDTTSELAFGCENLGWPEEKIRERMTQIVARAHIGYLMDRSVFALSGGEKQKIACASAAMPDPYIFVLDEPSSNLDLGSIAELGKVIHGWKEQGKTIVIAEHRLCYLMELVDRVLYMQDGRILKDLTAEDFKRLPREEISRLGLRSPAPIDLRRHRITNLMTDRQIVLSGFRFSYGKRPVLQIDHVSLPQGSIVGILGSNGAGKTTLARCLCGLEKKASGQILIDGRSYSGKKRTDLCYMVMQQPSHQLFTESVLDEVLLSMDKSEESQSAAEKILRDLDLDTLCERHPMSLSGGQQQRVAIAGAVASGREMLVFDEPTSGLDLRHMEEVANVLEKLQKMGKTLFVITHDPELIQRCCDHFLFMEEGKVSWCDGWNEDTEESLTKFFDQTHDK